MSGDHVLHGLLPEPGIRVLVASCGATAAHAARLHGCAPTASYALSHLFTGAVLVAGLGKDAQRVTLQIAGEGPLRGAFVDASADGAVRSFIRSQGVDPAPGRDPEDLIASFGRGALVSVLREQPDGKLYRATVELEDRRLDAVLERYFRSSEQIPTAVVIRVERDEHRAPAGCVGILLQRLPDGDEAALASLVSELRSVERWPESPASLPALAKLQLLSRVPVEYRCSCNRDRALAGVAAAGRAELEDMIVKDGGARLTCEFCRTEYVFDADELRAILAG